MYVPISKLYVPNTKSNKLSKTHVSYLKSLFEEINWKILQGRERKEKRQSKIVRSLEIGNKQMVYTYGKQSYNTDIVHSIKSIEPKQ